MSTENEDGSKKNTKIERELLDTSRMLKAGEVAKLLNISPPTLRAWCKQGRIKPVTSNGGHRYFNPKEIQMIVETKSSSVGTVWADKLSEELEHRRNFMSDLPEALDGMANQIKTMTFEEELCVSSSRDDMVEIWFIVRLDGEVVAALTHDQGQSMLLKLFSKHADKVIHKGLASQMADSIQSSIAPMADKVVERRRITGAGRYSFSEAMHKLCVHLARFE